MTEPIAIPSRKHRGIALAALAALSALIVADAPVLATGMHESADRLFYVLLTEGSHSSTMSGSMDDLRRARALRVADESLLYVRHQGGAYVIRDPATLRRADAIFEPQRILGIQQGELGSRQSALGRRQGALGAEQGRLGRLQAGASPSRQATLGREQGELGARQAALGREQAELGRQQGELGREQSRAAREAEAELRVLLADAIRSGVAQRTD